jgi:hypothetical protein
MLIGYSHSDNYWHPLNLTVTAFWAFETALVHRSFFFAPVLEYAIPKTSEPVGYERIQGCEQFPEWEEYICDVHVVLLPDVHHTSEVHYTSDVHQTSAVLLTMKQSWSLGLAHTQLGAAASQIPPAPVYVCMYVRVYVCMYVCMYVCVFVCLSVCMRVFCVCMHVCIMHACICLHLCKHDE